MTEAGIIDGKAFAARLGEKIAACVAALKRDHGLVPSLSVVLVGDEELAGEGAEFAARAVGENVGGAHAHLAVGEPHCRQLISADALGSFCDSQIFG